MGNFETVPFSHQQTMMHICEQCYKQKKLGGKITMSHQLQVPISTDSNSITSYKTIRQTGKRHYLKIHMNCSNGHTFHVLTLDES